MLEPKREPLLDAPPLGLLLDLVELADELEWDRSALVSQLPRCVEAATHVHHAAESSGGRDQLGLLAIVVFEETRVAAVVVDLDERVRRDGADPRRDLLGLPCLGEHEGHALAAAAEAPEVSAVLAALALAVEDIDARVVDAHVRWVVEDRAEQRIADRQEQRGGVAPPAIHGLDGNLEAQSRELVALPMDRHRIVALALDEHRQQRGGGASPDLGWLRALGRRRVELAARVLAHQHLAALDVVDELGRHVVHALVLDPVDAGHLLVAHFATSLRVGHQRLGHLALDRRRHPAATSVLALVLGRVQQLFLGFGVDLLGHGNDRALGHRRLHRGTVGQQELPELLGRQLLRAAPVHQPSQVRDGFFALAQCLGQLVMARRELVEHRQHRAGITLRQELRESSPCIVAARRSARSRSSWRAGHLILSTTCDRERKLYLASACTFVCGSSIRYRLRRLITGASIPASSIASSPASISTWSSSPRALMRRNVPTSSRFITMQ